MRRTLLPLLLLALLAAPAGAHASAGSDQIINQCANELLSGNYSQKDYQQALDDLPADLKEYTDCANVIRTAQRNAATSGNNGASPRAVGGGGGGGAGPTAGAPGVSGAAPPAATATGAAPATAAPTDGVPAAGAPATAAPATDPGTAAADQAALRAAQAAGAGAVTIDGTSLTPGVPAGAALSLSDLPTPMLVLLGLFVLIALLGLGAMVKSWVLGVGRSRDAADPS